MKNRVDLYTDEFKPKLLLLTFNFAIMLAVVALIAIVVVGVNVSQGLSEQQRQVMDLESLNESTRNTVDSFTLALRERKQDTGKLRELDALRATELGKRRIVEELSLREIQKQRTFSDLMVSLAEFHHPELWLTYIRMDTQRLHVEGTATRSDAVPQWVNNLNDAAYFDGVEFAGARLYRDEDTSLRFVLSSELIDMSADNGQSAAGGQ